jgi:hypothetical protein
MMFTHFVIVEDAAGTAIQYNYVPNPDNRRIVHHLYTPNADVEFDWDNPFAAGDDGEGFFKTAKFAFCNSEEEAKEAAGAFAKHQPGRRVLYGQVNGAAVAPPSEVTFQVVNEKGVLPQ